MSSLFMLGCFLIFLCELYQCVQLSMFYPPTVQTHNGTQVRMTQIFVVDNIFTEILK